MKSQQSLKTHWYWLVSIFFVMAACHTTPTPLLLAPEQLHKLSAKTVMNKLLERKSSLTDLKSFTRTVVNRRGTTQTLKQVVLIQNGSAIRVDTLSLFGNPIGVFIHDSFKTLIYDPSESRTYYGSQVWQVVERVMGFSIDFQETINLFSGNIIDNLKFKDGRLSEDMIHYRIEAFGPKVGEEVVIEVEGHNLIPTRLEKHNKSGLVYIVEWRDYRNIGNYLFAHRVILSRPNKEEMLTITYKQPKINLGLPSSAFKLVFER